ncbi:unnamed protein product [Cyprideis torosa]|uniref:Mediator of RNA polymerase II transcription subunit 10 n=1 Tax=Cyprideis torosa TaxID=163714 RepID=A0A7R8W1A9_9CRUS|nr:unnamed protein product [Cyprideis torosa]CAG0880664.1 unnamed protein product [Cyprideis torosa]
MASSSALENIESQLEAFIEDVRQICIIAGDFQPQGQPVFNQKIQSVIHRLQDLERLRYSVSDIQVPLEVFEYIDQGRNPQLYTKDCMEKALSKNEQVKGKIEAFKKFKAHLLVELSSTFPNEIAQYRSLRGDNC